MGSGTDRLPPDSATSARANGLAALTLLAALQRRGLEHLVLCPGSRSAPLAVAAALLERQGLRLHTAIDERSAAYFALGLGRALGRPAAVVTTSGTAVAQLLAAAVEADLGTIPLLLLSADRPQRLKNCGANQAVPQEHFLRACCRQLLEGPPEGLAAAPAERLEQLAGRAMAVACGDGRTAPAGPVHLNLPFEEPLHVDGADVAALEAALADLAVAGATDNAPTTAPLGSGGADAAPLPRAQAAASASVRATTTTTTAAASLAPVPRLDPDRPGVVVAGPWRGTPQEWQAHVEALRHWQRRSGWPLLADALSGLRGLPDLELVNAYDPLLESAEAMPPPGQVLRLGTLPASRRLQRWLQAADGRQVLISQGDPRRLDPLGVVAAGDQWSGGLAAWLDAVLAPCGSARTEGAPPAASQARGQRWRELEAAAQRALDRQLGDPDSAQQPLAAADTLQADRDNLAIAGDDRGGEVSSGWSIGSERRGDDHDRPAGEAMAATDRDAGGSDQGQGPGDGPGADADPGDRPGIGAGPDSDTALTSALGSARSDGIRSRDRSGDACGAGTGPHGGSAPVWDCGPAGEGLRGDAQPLSEPWLARALSRLLPPGLPVMLASSSPVRDWESFAAADAPWRPIHGFRGASGIDGTLSIACGLAEACGQLVLVSGDLALLHDANGWLWARQLRGRLTVVLIENGGGGIFEQLPIRTRPPERLDFERLFAMPQGVDQLALAAVHGVPGRRLRRAADLPGDLAWALQQPFALLELRTGRQRDAALRQRLRQAVVAAASGPAGRMAGLDSERP